MPFEVGHSIRSPGRPRTAKEITLALAYLLHQPYTGKKIQLPRNPTNSQAVARRLLVDTLAGNMEAMKELLNRYEGKVPQPLEDEDGNNISIENLTMHEVARRIVSKLMEVQQATPEPITIEQVQESPPTSFEDLL